MISKPIEVSKADNGKAVYVTFTHASEYRVLADVTVSEVPGKLHLARDPSGHWATLNDSLDRTILFAGGTPHKLLVDVEKVYQKYTMDQIVEVDDVKPSKWKKTSTKPVRST